MSNAASLNGSDLLTWAESATNELVARRAEINELNVFPVPDADTGSNMAHTMEAAVEQARSQAAQQLKVDSIEQASEQQRQQLKARDIATALSVGSVRGARGNSGVVLSQVLRGLAQAARDGAITGGSVKTALKAALSFVNRAISDPVEGTVITVLRAASIAAEEQTSEDIHAVTLAATKAASKALDKTPSQLAVLRKAGVVDAGGKGLLILLETLLKQVNGGKGLNDSEEEETTNQDSSAEDNGEENDSSAVSISHTAPDGAHSSSVKAQGIFIPGVGDFAVTSKKNASKTSKTPAVFEEEDSSAEDRTESSSPEAANATATEVAMGHRNEDTDGALSAATGDGPYLELMFFIEDADITAVEEAVGPLGDCLVVARLSDDTATVHIHSRQSGKVIETAFAMGTISDLRLEVLPDSGKPANTKIDKRVVIAVTPPGNLAELYSQAGAIVVTRASEAEDIVQAIVSEARASKAREIILLPNGLLEKNELASVERLSLAFEQSITLLPTANLVRGLAALAMHDPTQPLAVDTYAMSESSSAMRVASLEIAQKARLTQAGPCSKDDILAVSGGETLVVGEEILQTAIATCRRLLDNGGEQITMLVDTDFLTDLTTEKVQAGLTAHRHVDMVVYPADNLTCLAEIGVE